MCRRIMEEVGRSVYPGHRQTGRGGEPISWPRRWQIDIPRGTGGFEARSLEKFSYCVETQRNTLRENFSEPMNQNGDSCRVK